MFSMPQDETVPRVSSDKWAEVTPAFVVLPVQERKPEEDTAFHGKRAQRNMGSSPGVRKQQIALNYAIDDLLEIIESKFSDEEVRALAMRVQRLR
jgi:hypothetical protein